MENAVRTLRHYIALVEAANKTVVSVKFAPKAAPVEDAPENQFMLTLPGYPDDDEIRRLVRSAVSERSDGHPCRLVWQRVQAP